MKLMWAILIIVGAQLVIISMQAVTLSRLVSIQRIAVEEQQSILRTLRLLAHESDL